MSLKKLEVHHVTKRIHGNIVLQDISCTFLAGKIYGLKGIRQRERFSMMKRSWESIFVFRQALESFWKILLFWIPVRGCKI